MSNNIIPLDKDVVKAIAAKQNNYECCLFCNKCIYVSILGSNFNCNPETFKQFVDNFINDFARLEIMDIIKKIKRHDNYLTSRLRNVIEMCKDDSVLETVLKVIEGRK